MTLDDFRIRLSQVPHTAETAGQCIRCTVWEAVYNFRNGLAQPWRSLSLEQFLETQPQDMAGMVTALLLITS